MAVEAIDLLVHVHALDQYGEFLLEPLFVGFDVQCRQPLHEPLPQPDAHFGQAGPDNDHELFYPVAAFEDQRGQPLPFDAAGLGEVFQRRCKQGLRGLCHRFGVPLGGGHDARPAQYLERADGGGVSEILPDPPDRREQPFQGRLVDLDAAGVIVTEAQAKRAFDLAAFESVGRQAPEFGLDRPQFLGQPPGGFEVAVIDRSDFAGKRAPGFPYFAASEARHAVNHAVTFRTLFGGRRPRCAMREGSLYSRLLRPGGRVV